MLSNACTSTVYGDLISIAKLIKIHWPTIKMFTIINQPQQ